MVVSERESRRSFSRLLALQSMSSHQARGISSASSPTYYVAGGPPDAGDAQSRTDLRRSSATRVEHMLETWRRAKRGKDSIVS